MVKKVARVAKIDIDGTLLKSMRLILTVFLTITYEIWNIRIDPREARSLSASLSGLTFLEIIEELVKLGHLPKDATEEDKGRCLKKLNQAMGEIIETAPLFEGAIGTLKFLFEKEGFDLYISSSLDHALIQRLLEKHRLSKYFKGIFSVPKDGPKGLHSKAIRKIYNNECILFGVGDSKNDADGVDIFFWLYGEKTKELILSAEILVIKFQSIKNIRRISWLEVERKVNFFYGINPTEN